MAGNNVLELIVEVSTGAANTAIRGLNDGLAWFEQVAVKASTNASQGFSKFELEAARMMKSFASNVKQFISDPLGAAGMAIEGLLNKLGPLGVGLTGVVGAFGAVMAAGSAAAHSLGEWATGLENASIRTGLTVREVSQVSVAMKMAGGSVEDMETAMKMLSKGMAENSETGKAARKQLQEWGISAKSDTLTVMYQVSEQLSTMKSHWEQAAAAQAVFGKSGLTMLPMLLQLKDNMDAVKAAGLGTTDAMVKEMTEVHKQAELTDAKLASIKRTYFDKPLATVWRVVIDWAWGSLPGASGATGSPRDFGLDSFAYRQLGHHHLNSELRPKGIGDSEADSIFASDASAYVKRTAGKFDVDKDGAASGAKIEAGLEKDILGLYIQRLEKGAQIFAQGQERLAQLREEHELTAKTTSLVNIKTRMQWQNYSASLIPGLDKTPLAASAGTGYDLSFYADKAVVPTLGADVDPSILDKNAKAARDFALKGAAMGAKGGGTDAQLALLERRKQLGVDSLTLAEEQAQIQMDAETKLAQMQQDRITALKDGFNQVFDSLMSGGKNLMQTLMNLFKAAAITPIRNAFSSAFAGMMAPVMSGNRGFTGARGGSGFNMGSLLSIFRGSGSGGGQSDMGGIGAQAPAFRARASDGGVTGSPFDWANRDDGTGYAIPDVYADNPAGAMAGMAAVTPPFWGGAGGGSGAGASPMGGLNQIGMFAGMKNSLSNLGNIGMNSFAKGGVGGWQGGAMLAGGGMLAMDGLRRGGGIGMVEDTAGGALIGAKFGGPWGAVIGGAIGAGVGALRWAFGGKNETDRMKDAVKDAYGVHIDDTFAASLAKEAAGMDFRIFVQQDKIHNEIMLYAKMTQSKGGNSSLYNDNIARGVNLTESGGSLYQSATYSNGAAYGYQSTLASMGGFQTLSPNVTAVIQLDGRATTSALGGAAVDATGRSQGRTQLSSNLLSPAMGTI